MGLFSRNKSKKKSPDSEENQDWSVELRRSNLMENISEQQGFDFQENIDTSGSKATSGIKDGLSCVYEKISPDQVKILKKCKAESSADELMKIVKRSHKTRFKNDILNPLIECGFFERTIPEKRKSPKQKYRLTDKFVQVRISD